MSRSMTRLVAAVPAALLLGIGQASAQAPAGIQGSPAPPAADASKAWTFAASAYTYLLPDARDYVQPTVTADRGRLHLEARYNYEDYETGSAWIGCNFGGGTTVGWEFTPMVGGVIGTTTGIAPAYNGLLYWQALEFSSEGEFVIVPDDLAGSFFYNWSELALVPVDWFRVGLVMQRDWVPDGPPEIQGGVLLGFTWEHADLTAYVFNPGSSSRSAVIGLRIGF